MSVRIKDMLESDRPRERLLNIGVNNLSNEELLSIIISTGTKDMSVKEVSNNLLKKIKHISSLNDITFDELIKIKGIGISKACTIMAVIELSKRINSKVETIINLKFNNPSIIYEYYKNKLSCKKQEYFYTVYLNSSKKVIKEKLLFMGTINQSLVHPREIFKEAYLCDATSIICIHNHPSNNILPSREDYNITNKLIEIGRVFNVNVDDHIIIGKDKYYSFYENGDIR